MDRDTDRGRNLSIPYDDGVEKFDLNVACLGRGDWPHRIKLLFFSLWLPLISKKHHVICCCTFHPRGPGTPRYWALHRFLRAQGYEEGGSLRLLPDIAVHSVLGRNQSLWPGWGRTLAHRERKVLTQGQKFPLSIAKKLSFEWFLKENRDLPVNGAPNRTNPRSTINKSKQLALISRVEQTELSLILTSPVWPICNECASCKVSHNSHIRSLLIIHI